MSEIPLVYSKFSATVKSVLVKRAIKTLKEISDKETDIKSFTPTNTTIIDSKNSFRKFIESL